MYVPTLFARSLQLRQHLFGVLFRSDFKGLQHLEDAYYSFTWCRAPYAMTYSPRAFCQMRSECPILSSHQLVVSRLEIPRFRISTLSQGIFPHSKDSDLGSHIFWGQLCPTLKFSNAEWSQSEDVNWVGGTVSRMKYHNFFEFSPNLTISWIFAAPCSIL